MSLSRLVLLAGTGVVALIGTGSHASAETSLDLLAPAEWLLDDAAGWRLDGDVLYGRTRLFDGEKTDPEASVFLESQRVVGGDKRIDVEVTFDAGRYLGVYVDYDPETGSGIWMATGHALPADEQEHYVASAYIKTVERGHWVVRATGQLDVIPGASLSLAFTRDGDDYRVWQGDRLVTTYRKPGGYPPGKLQLRLVNAEARISRLSLRADEIGPARPARH